MSFHDQFTRKTTGDQFLAETEYLTLSGRRGAVACEIWGPRGNSCHMIPWHDAIARFCIEEKPFKQEEIMGYCGPTRENGKYIIYDFDQTFAE